MRDIDKLNSITIFTQVQLTSGTWPRHFTLSKSGKLMFVALQKKNLIDVFRIDQKNGTLSRLKTIDSPNSPAFVGIIWNCIVQIIMIQWPHLAHNNWYDLKYYHDKQGMNIKQNHWDSCLKKLCWYMLSALPIQFID